VHGAIGFHTGKLPDVLKSAEDLARKAVALDRADADARACLGLTMHLLGDSEGGRAEVERALAISPNLANAHGILGEILVFLGRPREGVSALEKRSTLDPLAPNSFVHLFVKGIGLYFLLEYDAACKAIKKTIRSHPEYPPPYRWLAATLGQLGNLEEAKQALEQAIAIGPTIIRRRVPWMRAEDYEHLLAGLRKAGWVD
jgi:adenylate cyclase